MAHLGVSVWLWTVMSVQKQIHCYCLTYSITITIQSNREYQTRNERMSVGFIIDWINIPLRLTSSMFPIVVFDLSADSGSFSNARPGKIGITFFWNNIFSIGKKIHHSHALARYACDFEADRSKTRFLRSKKPRGEQLILIHSLLNNYCPKGILCGRRLKSDVREYVRRRRRLPTDFRPFCHCSAAPGTHFLGGTVKASAISWNQWISQFCKNIPTSRNTRPVKNALFWIKSPRLVNGRPIENWRFWGSFCRYVFTFLTQI